MFDYLGAGNVQLLGDKLAMRALQHIRRGLRVAQQLVGRFAGVGLALA